MSFITMTLCHKYGNDIYLATMNTSIKYESNCGMRSESKKPLLSNYTAMLIVTKYFLCRHSSMPAEFTAKVKK